METKTIIAMIFVAAIFTIAIGVTISSPPVHAASCNKFVDANTGETTKVNCSSDSSFENANAYNAKYHYNNNK